MTMLSIMLSVTMLNAMLYLLHMLNVVMLNVIMLSVVTLIVTVRSFLAFSASV